MTPASIATAVLISAGRHPVSGCPRACRGDAVALAAGKGLGGSSLRVVHAGSSNEPALQDYLALGAGTVEVVTVPAAGDVLAALVSSLTNTDLILTGSRAEQGAGSGMLPYMLAKRLGRPVVADVLSAKVSGDEVHVVQFLAKGKRRRVAVRLPAVLVVHPAAPSNLTYAFARQRSGRIEVIPGPSPKADDVPIVPVAWKVSPAAGPPARLKAEERRSAHARLASAITAESKGGVVVIEGSHVDKAQVMLDYLREHRLIDF